MQGIKLLFVGKTDGPQLHQLIADYQRRLARFVAVEVEEVPHLKNRKNLSEREQKEAEGQLLLERIAPQDRVILLDERGSQPTSLELAKQVERWQMGVARKLIFVVGGPYGFSDALYAASHERLSLSRLTFSHQMVRIFLVEQLYRAYTIIHNHPYHHE